jgi:acetyl-CoA carboxylase carboxyl transferase subunit alpha
MAIAYPLEFEKPLVELDKQIDELKRVGDERGIDVASELTALQAKLETKRAEIYAGLEPMQRVMVARHPRRPYTLDYLSTIFTDFIELHGDRLFRDDPAIVGGWARLGGTSVMVIGHQKGRDTKDNIKRNFGMPHPEGYRKALRLMQMAARFGAPIITLIDTPGAFPGLGAEERGQSEALARNILEMSVLPTPIIAVVIGEGGSGGALALGVADRILMFENSVYSVISPEGCRDPLEGCVAAGARRRGAQAHRQRPGDARPRGRRPHRAGRRRALRSRGGWRNAARGAPQASRRAPEAQGRPPHQAPARQVRGDGRLRRGVMQTVEVRFKGNRRGFRLARYRSPAPPERAGARRGRAGPRLWSRQHHRRSAREEVRRLRQRQLRPGRCPDASVMPRRPSPRRVRPVVRRASPAERRAARDAPARSRTRSAARSHARAGAHGLAMRISDAEWQWDKQRLTVYFTAEQRVDFRALVRELAGHYRTRIELRQIGVREEAARLGGSGAAVASSAAAPGSPSRAR